jgi:hypothetical protein
MKGKNRQMSPIALEPGETSHPIARIIVERSTNYAELRNRGCISVRNVAGPQPFVTIERKTDESVKVRYIGRPPGSRRKRLRRLRLARFQPTRPVYPKALPDKKNLRLLRQRKALKITPVSYIAPAARGESWVGWYGDDRVYVCDKCGGAIVFRGSPPTPIHI